MSRRWLSVSMAVPPEAAAILLVDALRGLGARSVERDADRVVAVFPPRDDPQALATEVELAVRANTTVAEPSVRWGWIDHDGWVRRQAGHPPRRVSENLTIIAATSPGPDPAGAPGADPDTSAGAAEREATAPGALTLRLEPSTAFGSAEHPTTRACLRMLDGLVEPRDRVLDVGAGSGVLAIAAGLLGADRVTALEADAVSCAAARRNIELNGVQDRVRVREVEVVPGTLRHQRRQDGIVANIQADILRPLMGDLAGALSNDGWLILSGVLRVERTDVVETARAVGLRLDEETVEDGWWTGRWRWDPGYNEVTRWGRPTTPPPDGPVFDTGGGAFPSL